MHTSPSSLPGLTLAYAHISVVIAGLDPAIHPLRKTLCEDRWIRGPSPRRRGFGPAGGSSPRMTGREIRCTASGTRNSLIPGNYIAVTARDSGCGGAG